MKLNKKIELTAEERAELEKKEMRNEYIGLAISVVATVAGIVCSRKLQKNLNAEVDQMIKSKEEVVED